MNSLDWAVNMPFVTTAQAAPAQQQPETVNPASSEVSPVDSFVTDTLKTLAETLSFVLNGKPGSSSYEATLKLIKDPSANANAARLYFR